MEKLVKQNEGHIGYSHRQIEDRFRATFQASRDSVNINRLDDGTFVDINDGFTVFTGYSREDIADKSFRAADLWQEQQEFDQLVERVREHGSVLNMDARFRDKKGHVITGSISAMVMDFNGEPHLLSVVRDTDILKKTEDVLAVSEARFRELFNNMSSGVVVLQAIDDGKDFIVVDINRAVEKIENVRKSNILGLSVNFSFPSVERYGLSDVYRRVWQTGMPERYPVAIYRDKELKVWKDNYIFKLPSGEIIDVYDDITERRRAEDRLLEYQEQLRSLTSELSLAEERQRRSIATDLHDQIGQTLSVIKMKLYGLMQDVKDDSLAGRLDDVLSLLKKTIQDTRSLTFEISPPILYELGLDAAIEWLGENFQKQHNIPCVVESDNLFKPLGEDVRIVLFMAVRELLINVAKHARADSVRIIIKSNADTLKIMVKDHGIGFDPDAEENKAVNTHAFGLFNIRERLQHLGGHLTLESAPGSGTIVSLVAPLKINNETDKES